jgi:hypothetical protein
MTLNENTTPHERALILNIADRAMADGPAPYTDKIRAVMDLTVLHCNGCPLDLPALLAASEANFWHDINGIAANLNRATGQLNNLFQPRHSAPEAQQPNSHAEIQLIDFSRTGTGFNAYLVTPSATTPCDWGQTSNMTRAEAIKLARAKGYEPTIRHTHQVWLKPSLTTIARAGYEAHDRGEPENASPYARTSPFDTGWRVGWHMADRGYVAPSLNERDAVRIGRGSQVHIRDQTWTLTYDGQSTRVERIT